MTGEEIFKLIERNSGESIEESSKNGIMAHSVDVDCLIDDIQKALNVGLADAMLSLQLLKIAKCPACDGSGAIPQGNPQDPEWEQCQWCDERNRLISNEA